MQGCYAMHTAATSYQRLAAKSIQTVNTAEQRDVACSCVLTQARALSTKTTYSDESFVIADLPREL